MSKLSESEKQRIECGSAADQRVEKKQRIEQDMFDTQRKSDELLLKVVGGVLFWVWTSLVIATTWPAGVPCACTTPAAPRMR